MKEFSQAKWLNPPKQYVLDDHQLRLTTDPHTDFWQRSYYGFRNDNAPALLLSYQDNFSVSVKVSFDYQKQFDQAGVIIYLDSENWFKASIEFETAALSRLGSVVTNLGYSDWATTDISTPQHIWYRLSRRGPDFLIEYSQDGEAYQQMRVFHLHQLGETASVQTDPPAAAKQAIKLGLYACSPSDSSFTACFEQLTIAPCRWRSHPS
ncbi:MULTISPECIES: DUF1349 domain-containing protein [unclassified Agarivorans]|uniref:DUF1349 domain-containing protein n=1 Tax=unclassified Agarivorans TaxID=2636026 RepID=UPI0026E1A896|nr:MULTISPECIES: DUF1349 domain-containing protein [unclassified Agarivorans]MDO6686521.1 DUF1349 domain-containing protein [Agarivorans sp. 3_MG-2023]MDO6715339.1 DUF1349 domain-containing protein [Agarivorans sp. 2_MG-2023]